MSMHEELLNLYGGGKVDDVEKSTAFSDLCGKYADVEGYSAEQIYVSRLRRTIQELLTGQRPKNQVMLCLKLLYRSETEDERKDYHRLIELAYRPAWNSAQQTHFDDAYAVIIGNVYYFLSFTKHNMTSGAVNIVNKYHRHLIEDTFLKELKEIGDFTKENLLAEAINHFLGSKRLKGFYYPLHERDNAIVKKKLKKDCNGTLTFIQIMHGAIFEKAPEQNYCYFEYDQVRKSQRCKKLFFVLAEDRNDLNAGVLLYEDFDSWLSTAIDERHALDLIPTEDYDDSAIRENRENIREKIVKAIQRIQTEMFNDVPA